MLSQSETTSAAQWAENLDDFERAVLPVFERRGYDRGTALLAHIQSQIFGQLALLVVIANGAQDYEEDDDDDDTLAREYT